MDGIEMAKARARQVVSTGKDLMERKNSAIVGPGPFKIAYLHDAEERKFPITSDSLEDLGLYLVQALNEDNSEEDEKPVIVAALQKSTSQWLVVAVGSRFEFEEVGKSRFGEYFAEAAEKSGIEIVQDSFESCVCTVPNDNMFTFIDQLSLLAWGYET